VNDLFEAQLTQEERWQIEIRKTQVAFQQRVEEAWPLGRKPTKRKEIYQRWRKEFGDDIARESARFVEALIKGEVKRPRWFR
jgi:hypothetical protein